MPETALTLRSLFDVNDQDAKRVIFDAVDGSVWDQVAIPRSLREAAAEKVAGTLNALLATPLSDTVANAFNGYTKLAKYADDQDHDVAEGDFSIESEHTPYVELKVTGLPAKEIKFPLTLSLNFSAVVLVIKKSHIVALRAGTCTASGKLSCEKIQLYERELKPVKLPGELPFGIGIRIFKMPH
ncbi:MAG: hypothetical protein ABJE10_16885 [bacterium]